MLYLLIVDGGVAKVVDSPTDLDRLPFEDVKRMCRALKVPVVGSDGRQVRVQAIRPESIVAWDVDRTKLRRRHVGIGGHK